MSDLNHDPIVQHLIAWGRARDDVRAMILTSTLTNPNAPTDLFSDYDVIFVLTNIQPYFDSREWLNDMGRLMVLYRDPIRLEYGCGRFAYITQYEGVLKIDYTLMPVELWQHIVAEPELRPDLDVGYQVLLDKDHLTDGLKPPTYSAYIPKPPSPEEYFLVVEEFFHEATYVAKNLWRDELLPAKFCFEFGMRLDNLRQMLEWRMEIDHNWSLKTGALGKGLKKHLPPAVWAEFEQTFARADINENWDAMFKTIDLFRKVALEVAAHLGYTYPETLHREMVEYFQKVRTLDRGATSF
jgi:aminoglycoside 6-adenylyltransferase